MMDMGEAVADFDNVVDSMLRCMDDLGLRHLQAQGDI